MSGGLKYNLFINGTWRPGCTAAELALINPATEEDFGRVAAASASDLDEALQAAQESYLGWSRRPAIERG
ncbi:aldehyde dehydrogenase family protein, partial [Sinorhizobium meliloti]|nr:aldehyde dehydrogenase family protein [Sinorhizobium meliloti]MDW9850863.1 aldehyde dehydrogenase family protein [Sinorhizobium meliloti]MDX0147665.1 aldehyde dehydrogenase family protein [Sinorhizobium meliloti]MDX0153934.1 aldehyde dehydrogenase family protein [Sinorhizobium meliloti]MDX0172841.1 aldehyde dehydrogenase family protein [Sinorhizobium meliloti]